MAELGRFLPRAGKLQPLRALPGVVRISAGAAPRDCAKATLARCDTGLRKNLATFMNSGPARLESGAAISQSANKHAANGLTPRVAHSSSSRLACIDASPIKYETCIVGEWNPKGLHSSDF